MKIEQKKIKTKTVFRTLKPRNDKKITHKKSKYRLCIYRLIGAITILIILSFVIFRILYDSKESLKNLVHASQFKITQIKENRNLKDLSKIDTTDISEHTYSQSELVSRISKHIIVPQEDISMLVKVKNAESLRTQDQIYADIKNDDYILIYPNLAIIYDAKTDEVIKYMPLR